MRFHALDVWRGVAALLIIFFHLSANGMFRGFPPIRNSDLSVPFFFVLSGFVITHAYGQRLGSRGDIRRFVTRRIGRLYPLHIVVLGALALLELGKWMLTHFGVPSGQAPFAGGNDIGSLIANLFLLQAIIPMPDYSWNGPSWSISVEFYTYLIFCAVVVWSRARTIAPAILLVVASSILLTWLDLHHPEWPQTRFKGLATCVCGFFVGHLAYKAFGALPAVSRSGATALEVLALAAITLLYWFAPLHGVASMIVFAAIMLVFASDGGAVSRMLAGQPWAFLGKISYSIYMVHFVLVSFLGGIVRAAQSLLHQPLYRNVDTILLMDFGPAGTMDLLALAYAAAVIGLATLTYRWIELPGQRLFERSVRPARSGAPQPARASAS